MEITAMTSLPAVPEQVLYDLRKLNVPIHLSGHRQLCVAIPKFAEDIAQPMCGELYPAVAKTFGLMDWRAIEFSIRRAIPSGWEHGCPDVWNDYFPGICKAPTNKQFIATLSMRIK